MKLNKSSKDKLMLVLEHYLSLHEADAVWNAIVNDDVDEVILIDMLNRCSNNDE